MDVEKINIQMPDKVTLEDLQEKFRVGSTEYSKAHKRARMLDAVDRNKLWEAVQAKFPDYQILPDTNNVSYIKNNLLASIYTVGKSAKLLPTSDTDKQIVEQLNIALENIWSTLHIYKYQMMAGDRAALLNYGITQVGWDNSLIGGKDDTFFKGNVKLKNIDPLKFMRDPFATELETASWCCTWEDYHKSIILAVPGYKQAFEAYLASKQTATNVDFVVPNTDKVTQSSVNKKDYYRVYTYWTRVGTKIHEVHVIDNAWVLLVKENLKPATFPFAELYCNLPAGDLFGTSECSRIFSNNLAYNIMLSIVLTSEYKNQRPPRFVNNQSGLNVATFVKHGNDADRTFVVSGDASKAVHYQQFPAPTIQAVQAMNILSNDIKSVTGIDDRYTGRDTGSVLTTGGIENMLDQVTMIDAPKIINYESYCERLTSLIIYNYLEFSAIKRKYFVQDKKNAKIWNSVTVDFPSISADTVFNYEINVSSELPKNKARIESVANHLMEMQMQYQGQGTEVDIITPQEWLMSQDLPMKEFMQERMDIQRTQNYTELVAHAVTQYAALVEQGVNPEEAIAATADSLSMQGAPNAEEAVAEKMQMLGGMK